MQCRKNHLHPLFILKNLRARCLLLFIKNTLLNFNLKGHTRLAIAQHLPDPFQ